MAKECKLNRSKEKPLVSSCQRLFVRLSRKRVSAHPNTSTDAARRRFGGLRQPGVKDGYRPKAPVPPAGEKEMRKHLGGLGRKPQRVQGSALPPAAQAAPPARSGCRAEPCRQPRRR